MSSYNYNPSSAICAKCKYRDRDTKGVVCECNYILIEGKMRGCEPGDGCKKYVKGPAVKRNKWRTTN